MSEAVGGGPRMKNDPVTDAGGTPSPPANDGRSGFQFDLGGALSRLGGDTPSDNGDSPAPDGRGQPPAATPPPPPPTDEQMQRQPAPPAFEPLPAQQQPSATPTPDLSAPAGFGRTPTGEQAPSPHQPPTAPAPGPPPMQPPPVPPPPQPPPARAGFEWLPTTEPASSAPGTRPDPIGAPLDEHVPPRPAPATAAPDEESLPVQQPQPAAVIEPLPTRRPPDTPVIEPLPTRRPAAPVADASSPAPPVIEPLPTRQPRSPSAIEPLPTRAAPPPVIEPLPTRQPEPSRDEGLRSLTAQPADSGSQAYVAPVGRSVFDDPAPAPTLPATPTAAPPPAPAVAPAGDPQLAPSVPDSEMPVLPKSSPVVAPPVAEPIDSAPSTPDVHALRAAQLRASRNQRQGKLFGRSLLAFLIIGALTGGALLFGRAYLFSAEWDPALTPIVDDIQQARGADFSDPAPLVVQSEAEYSSTLMGLTIGSAWVDRLPEWRALGIAGSDATADSVAVQLTGVRTAVYDPSSNTIYQLAEADPAATADDLRWALETAFAHQAGSPTPAAPDTSGFVGVSAQRIIVRDAVDAALVATTVERSRDLDSLPLPIAYEMSANETLGEPLLAAAGLESTGLQVGDELPEAVYGLLDDQPANAASGLLQPGERALADPVALGDDDWSLVWGTRLPADFVDQLTEIVVADLYRPIDRSGEICFVGVFETASEEATTTLFDGMLLWVSAGPAGSQGVASQLDGMRVQLEACDPGSEATTPALRPVDDLIERQIARLSN